MYPDHFHYTKEHEWVSIEGEIGTIGITDHAQHELGDIVYVDLPKIGDLAAQGKAIGSVESVKAVSDIYSPVSGEVVEINTGNDATRNAFSLRQLRNQEELARMFRSAGVDAIQLSTDQPYGAALGRFFETREKRRLRG